MSNTTPTSSQPNAIFCTACGTRNEPGQRFCSNCGSALAVTQPPVAVAPAAVAPPKKKRSFLRWCLIAIGVLFLLGIIASIVGGDDDATDTATRPSAASASVAVTSTEASAASSSAAVETASAIAPAEPTVAASAAAVAGGVGQDITVGDVRWKILEATDAGTSIETAAGAETTTGRYIRLRFEVENQSKEERNFGGISLVDSQGRTFESASTNFALFSAIPENERCTLLEPLAANLPKTCQLIFELPANAGGLVAKVGDLKMFGAKEANVALGLAEPDPAAAAPAGDAPVELAEGQPGAINQSIKVGDVRWKVLEATDAGQSVKSPGGTKTTQGKFLRVRVEVENMSNSQLNFTQLELVDSQDRTFEDASSDFELLMAIPEEERCSLLEPLAANLPKTCQIFFEVPANATGLKLKLGDLKMFGAKEALVDLGQ